MNDAKTTQRQVFYLFSSYVKTLQTKRDYPCSISAAKHRTREGSPFLEIIRNKVNNIAYVYKPMKNYILKEVLKDGKEPENEFLKTQFDILFKLTKKLYLTLDILSTWKTKKV